MDIFSWFSWDIGSYFLLPIVFIFAPGTFVFPFIYFACALCPFLIKSRVINQLLCDSPWTLWGVFFSKVFQLLYRRIIQISFLEGGVWVGGEKRGRDEKKRMLCGRMEGAHSRSKWFVALHRGFQIISFPAPQLTLILRWELEMILPCFIATLPSSFWHLDSLNLLPFQGPLHLKKKIVVD